MGTFETTIEINRPADEVFAVLADTEAAPRWYEAVVSAVKTTAGPVGRGTRYPLARSLPAGMVENEVEIEEHEPSRRVTLASVSGPTPFRYRYRLDPTGPRPTTATLPGDITADGLPGDPATLAPLATPLFARGMRQNLLALKRVIETGP